MFNPILHTAWLDNHTRTLNSYFAKYYFGEKYVFLQTFLQIFVNQENLSQVQKHLTFNAISVWKKVQVNLDMWGSCHHDLFQISGMFIPDPGSDIFQPRFRIQGQKNPGINVHFPWYVGSWVWTRIRVRNGPETYPTRPKRPRSDRIRIHNTGLLLSITLQQCCGFGSVGSVCFWASWIRIRIHLVRGMDPDPDASAINQKY
jgi:hypothetical protein